MLTRRSLIATAVAAGAAGGSAAVAAPATDFSRPEALRAAIVKMRGSFGPAMFMGFVVGRYFGYSEGRLTPLYGLLAGTFSKCRPLPNGDVRVVSFEIAYFTDWDSGEALHQWRNPYTGKQVAVDSFHTPPGTSTIAADGRVVPDRLPPGAKVDDRFLKVVAIGPDVWLTESSGTEFVTGGKAPPFHYNELTTLHATQADLADPRWQTVPTTVSFQAEVSWRPWQQMGDTPGHLVGNAAGRKITRLEDFPPNYLPWCRRDYPEVFVDLDAYLDRGWA